MLKNKNILLTSIALITVAVVLVIAFAARLYVKSALVTPSNQITALDRIRVMHSDSYWSPLDECTNCHQVRVPSLQSSIDRAKGSTTLDSESHSDQPSADGLQVSENRSYTAISNIAKSKHDAVQAAIANTR